MNYRHAYHAGNFADVVKHVILSRIVEYLKRKDQAFRVIDTHAGIGLYDLRGTEAEKTGEWIGGISRVMDAVEKVRSSSQFWIYWRLILKPFVQSIPRADSSIIPVLRS